MQKHVIGITGTGSLIGQAIIKSIIRSPLAESLRLIGFDYFEDTVGSFWCEENYLLPDILKVPDAEKWFDAINRTIVKEKIELLFIGVDFELPLFAERKKKIESDTGCKVVVSDKRIIEIADDKYLTYQFLKENQLYYPATFLPAELNGSAVHFPCILKPRHGARSRDVYVIQNETELKQRIPAVEDPVVQELVGSMNEEYTCGVIFLDGEVKEMIALNRTLKAGNTYKSSFSRSYPPVIYEYLEAVSKKLQPFGACNFQLRLDNNGVPRIFEINARHSGTTYIRSLFGFKEVEYIIQYLLGGKIPIFQLTEGTAIRYYDESLL